MAEYRISSLMVDNLPLMIGHKAMARERVQISGYLPSKKLPRLSRLYPLSRKPVGVVLGCELSSVYGCVLLTMEIETTLLLNCQRCLSPLSLELRLQKKLHIVSSDAHARQLPRSAECYVCAEDRISSVNLIEDELFLAIPDNPMHRSRDECNPEFIRHLNCYRHRSRQNDNPFAKLRKVISIGDENGCTEKQKNSR